MRRTLMILGAMGCLLGCQNQNPYAMFGPSTIAPPSVQAPIAGYYPPPAGPTVSTGTGTALVTPADSRPAFGAIQPVPAKSTAPGAGTPAFSPGNSATRTDLSPAAPALGTRASISAPSFSAGHNFAAEQPVRVVEASPAATRSGSFANSNREAPGALPTGIVTATPASRTSAPSGSFGTGAEPVELSQLPKAGVYAPTGTSSDYNRTRGFIPAQPQTPAVRQPGSSGSFRTDTNVRSATYLEAVPAFREAPPADGSWRAR